MPQENLREGFGGSARLVPTQPPDIEVGLLTGGFDRPYAFGLAMALSAQSVRLEVIGSDEVDGPEMHTTPGLKFLNWQGNPRQQIGLARKAGRVLGFYARLLRYSAVGKPKIIHILWNNKLQIVDRTLLMLYHKLLGKKVVLTVHNVNAGKRDGNDSALNRLSLRIQYRLADHLFVHTEKMKSELIEEFGVGRAAITVIPFGINNAVPQTDLTSQEAKQRLGFAAKERVILFFGALRPYKGLEHLVSAFQQIASRHPEYRLLIAGESKKGSEEYVRRIQEAIERDSSRTRVTQKIEFVPDAETEWYFKAADVSVLPYTMVFQSGVLFLSYSFGLPVIATDVGSFQDDIVTGENGFVCRPNDPDDLSRAIEEYFESDLARNLETRRPEIKEAATAKHSWDLVGETTRKVYEGLLKGGKA